MSLSSKVYSFVVEQKCIPWSISHRFEQWMETAGRVRTPVFYQLVRFRRLRDIMRPVTRGPKHHFFGYYDKSPWNSTGNLLAAHEVEFNDRPPGVHGAMLDRASGRWRALRAAERDIGVELATGRDAAMAPGRPGAVAGS
jgi:hypothetical protein